MGFVLFVDYSKKVWQIRYDTEMVTYTYTSYNRVMNMLVDDCDESSIIQINMLMDGEIHYLHEVDEGTIFGEMLLNELKNVKGEFDFSNISSFEDFENLIKTKVPEKVIAICYKDGFLEIYIPNSNWNPRFWGKKGEIKVRSEVEYNIK